MATRNRKTDWKHLVPASVLARLEENARINSKKPIRNKSMAAFAAHQGEVWVADPMLLL